MGEPIPGQGDDEFIESDEVIKDKFDEVEIIGNIVLRVFWNLAIDGYVFTIKYTNQSNEEALMSAFTDDDEKAKEIFEVIKNNIIPENSDQSLERIYDLIQSEINKK